MLDTRMWYYQNVLCSEEEFYRQLPIVALEQMYLPEIPKDIEDILEVKWRGRCGQAISPMDAFLDSKNIPMIQINLKNKKYNLSEDYPYHVAHKEISVFIETARELKNEV